MPEKYNPPGGGIRGLCAFWNGFIPGKPKFTEKDYPKLNGKVVIVTGATSGVGYEVAKSLLGSTNAKVYLFNRSEQKTIDVIKRLEVEVANEYNKSELNVDYILVDYADLPSIKPAAEQFLNKEERLDLIIHNAGIMAPPLGSKTKQGFDLQLGTNDFGPHLLQKFLDPLIIKTSKRNKPGETRIVWVSSFAHFSAPLGGVHYSDPNFTKTEASPMQIYGQSKALNIIQARAWNSKHPDGSNIISVSLCPGFLNTELQRHGGSFQLKMSQYLHKARFGAYTELFAAFAPEVKTGDHIESFGKVTKSRKDLEDPKAISKGWEFLDENVKPYL
ncbi:short-chain alcohol dehydrogenase [Scheffersomyces coipomensis]|uniref:short-chain alcohol dehydrogenase n=1 Tax=Scheffersomyces coipomensis TaxID=1788519 RepID=UPI00315D94BB